ncbi:acyltransferase [Novosphingobium sp. TCA1]|uniref:acyltransferase family protein n=1 Tax=Novosphingobium sp. TCA1 TaxID=2682474 RepID=UPI0013098295|nr:acyltransferase [Novosphingobium sp. TCA1]GFE73957.1 acyltransferase [Novosphingobium sp. TCA1]
MTQSTAPAALLHGRDTAVASPRSRESSPAKKRQGDAFNPTVHALRGIAAMMVFLAHVIGGVGENVYAQVPAYLAVTEAPWNFGRWGVWLFFVISGYVILPSVMRYSPREFALRRFFRLYPLFLAFSLVFIAVNAWSNAFPELNHLGTILPALLMVNLLTRTEQLTPNAWSLSYEVLFYAVTCLTVHMALRRPLGPSASRTATVLLALVSAGLIYRFPAMAFFLGGICVRLLDDRGLRPPAAWRVPLELLAFAGCLYFGSVQHYGFLQKEMGNPYAYAVLLLTPAYFYLAIAPGSLTSRLLDRRAAFYLGTVSYSLYLAHPYTYFVARHIFVRLGLFGANWPLSLALFMAVVIPVTLGFTQIVYRLLERYPYHWYFHERVFHRRREAERA